MFLVAIPIFKSETFLSFYPEMQRCFALKVSAIESLAIELKIFRGYNL